MEDRIKIRFVIEEDLDDIITLCKRHAAYEKAGYNEEGKKEALFKGFFSPSPSLYCFVAVKGERVVGYATYMFQYSTWEADRYTYLDCLYLVEEVRGKGIGEKLMLQVKKASLSHGIRLMQWQTPDFNEGAIRFYKRLGGVSKSKERFTWELSSSS